MVRVRTASGALVAISRLRKGEKVLATITRTGKTGPAAVTAVLLHYDKDLLDLEISVDGRNAVIRTTSSHLFWDLTQGRWVKAGALKYGDHLRTPTGSSATVVGDRTSRRHEGWMWDITVPGPHDFYVRAATAAVLVHNGMCFDLPSPFGKDVTAVIGRRPDINAARPWPGHDVLTLGNGAKRETMNGSLV